MTLGDQDQALLDYLMGRSDTNVEVAVPVPHHAGSETDNALRAWGYNRIERERLHRGTPRPKDDRKFRAANFKRFEHYLTQRLPDQTAAEIAGLARAWVSVTDCNLDLARHWWASGVDPASPGLLADAIAGGFEVHDLGEVINGRTVAEHLQAGNSLRWCMFALEASRSRQ